MNVPADTMRPFASLGDALSVLLASLRDFIPLRQWMVARRDDQAWNLMQTMMGRGLEAPAPAATPAPDQFACLDLAGSMQPHFMADTGRVDSRVAAALASAGIGACIACPLISRRGELLGALCAIDPEPQPEFTAVQCRLVTGIAKTLATLFAHSLRHEDARYRMPAGIDGPTGLPNLHAWQHILEEEESALMEHGENALAAIVELEGAGSSAGNTGSDVEVEVAMAHHAALLKGYLRDRDIVARIGHGRFALLLRHLNEEQAQSAQEKIDQALRQCGVPAAIGCAMRLSSGSLPEAFRIADIRMYNAKLRRH